MKRKKKCNFSKNIRNICVEFEKLFITLLGFEKTFGGVENRENVNKLIDTWRRRR